MNYEHGGKAIPFSQAKHIRVDELMDFSASINPLGMAPLAIEALKNNFPLLTHYPDPDCTELVEAIMDFHHLGKGQILIGNGSIDLIHLLPRVFKWRSVIIPVPTFCEYENACELAGTHIRTIELKARDQYQIRPEALINAMSEDIDAVFICNPNNPTGHLLEKIDIIPVIQKAMENRIMVVMDEAFVDYAEDSSLIRKVTEYPNLIILRSFTKFFAMPGLRVGYLVADQEVIHRLEKVILPWSVNHLAQVAARMSLLDHTYIRTSREVMEMERPFLSESLSEICGITVYPSHANFLLMKLSQDSFEIGGIEEALSKQRTLVRNCASFRGLGSSYFRVAIRSRRENIRLVTLFQNLCSRGIH